jgi:superfamily II DNA or RNA helicase
MLKKSQYKLYEDQEISVAALLDKVRDGEKRILFVGATGSGKTAISAELKRRLHPRKMLFVVHRDVLIEQTIKTLVKSGFPLSSIGVIAGRYGENRKAPIQILSIQTAPRRSLHWFDWEVAFFDEAHTTGWSSWALKLHKENPDRPIIYLTATPWRLSKRQSFTNIVPKNNYIFAPLPSELTAKGRLVQPVYFKALEVELSKVGKQNGDYKVSDLSVVCNNPKVISSGLKFWQERYPNERTIAFAVSVEHAETVTKMANEAGRKAALVHGDTPIPERDRHYKALRDHRIDMVVSVGCLTEGFDVPNISCVWLLRPTLSKAIFYQQIGRGLRVAEGKTRCIILDQSGNIGKHKLVENLTTRDFYDVFNDEKGDTPIRVCPECGAVSHPSYKECPCCGYEFPVNDENKAIAVGKIIEVTAATEKNLRANPQSLSPEEFFIFAMDEIFANEWHPIGAQYRFQDAFNTTPPKDFYWRWTRFRKITPDQLEAWLKSVDERRHSENKVQKTWLKKLTPPENTNKTFGQVWHELSAQRDKAYGLQLHLLEPVGIRGNVVILKTKTDSDKWVNAVEPLIPDIEKELSLSFQSPIKVELQRATMAAAS